MSGGASQLAQRLPKDRPRWRQKQSVTHKSHPLICLQTTGPVRTGEGAQQRAEPGALPEPADPMDATGPEELQDETVSGKDQGICLIGSRQGNRKPVQQKQQSRNRNRQKLTFKRELAGKTCSDWAKRFTQKEAGPGPAAAELDDKQSSGNLPEQELGGAWEWLCRGDGPQGASRGLTEGRSPTQASSSVAAQGPPLTGQAWWAHRPRLCRGDQGSWASGLQLSPAPTFNCPACSTAASPPQGRKGGSWAD